MEVNRKDLLDVLNLVRAGLSQKEIIEQSNHFIFNKDEILAYNDELLISYSFDIELQCTVDASLFLKLISRMTSSTVSIELKKEKLEIWNAKTSAHIPIVQESEIFEYIQNVMKGLAEADWHKLSQDFIDGLRLCAFSAETDRTKGTLTCVRVEGEDIMSGSRNRCSWYKMDKAVDEDFYIEAALIEELSKYEDVSSYTLSKSWAHFKSESGVTFSARRVIPLELLPFRSVLEEFQIGVRVRIPADLKSSIETVNIVNEDEQGADKWVRLIISDETITCKAETKKGTIIEEVPFEKPIEIGNQIELSVNPMFLMDVLEKATFMYFSDESILFKRQAFQHLAMLARV